MKVIHRFAKECIGLGLLKALIDFLEFDRLLKTFVDFYRICKCMNEFHKLLF